MTKRHMVAIALSVCIGIGMAFASNASSTDRQKKDPLLNGMRQLDQMQRLIDSSGRSLIGGRIASFIMTRNHPVFGEAQGKEIMHCTVAWSSDECAIIIQSVYDDPPVYQLAGRGPGDMDYDLDGNLYVWRPLTKIIVSTKGRNEAVENLEQFLVGPNGEILRVNSYTQKYIYQIGDTENTYIFDQFRLATGLGIVQHLKEISSSDAKMIEARGEYGASLPGMWNFRLDGRVGQIVREGEFFVEGENTPIVTFENSGVIGSSKMKAAKNAVFRVGNYEAAFEVISVEAFGADERGDIFDSAINMLYDQMPLENAEIIDFRRKKPIRTPLVDHKDR